jgi:DNA-binding transcriptional regulator YhcF (GntR family)
MWNDSMTVVDAPQAHDELLYEQIAQRIAGMIDGGTLRVGQRVPSVRKLSGQMGVSISTVLQAYRVLESRGRIEARPQSGYYVKPPARALLPAPGQSRPPRVPTKVRIMDRVIGVLRATADPTIVPLGGAVAGPDRLPTKQLTRIQSAIARRSPRAVNAYDGPSGLRELRVQIARRYMDAGCTFSPDDIITTCGCQESISLALRTVANSGDVIAIDSPVFYGHLQAIESLGMRALEIPTCPDVGMDLDALRAALKQHDVAAVLSVTNCQNPLGFIMPEDKKREMVELLARHDVPLIEDDIFGDLTYARPRPKVCKAYDEKDLGAAVQFVLEDARSRGARRLGRAGAAVSRATGAFEDLHDIGHADAAADGDRGVSVQRRVRPLPASRDGSVRRASAAGVGCGPQILPAQHKGDEPVRRLCAVGRDAGRDGRTGAARAGATPEDQRRAGADLLGQGEVRELHPHQYGEPVHG